MIGGRWHSAQNREEGQGDTRVGLFLYCNWDCGLDRSLCMGLTGGMGMSACTLHC